MDLLARRYNIGMFAAYNLFPPVFGKIRQDVTFLRVEYLIYYDLPSMCEHKKLLATYVQTSTITNYAEHNKDNEIC